MSDFETLWKSASGFRRVSRELRPLLRDVHAAFADRTALVAALERLLSFLTSESGRTDPNCAVTDAFIFATEEEWSAAAGEELRPILEDMGGTLHDTIYAPNIARNFDSTPEQLLERLRKL
jgi:hypothetical protein